MHGVQLFTHATIIKRFKLVIHKPIIQVLLIFLRRPLPQKSVTDMQRFRPIK
jgi:hypothetical protein